MRIGPYRNGLIGKVLGNKGLPRDY